MIQAALFIGTVFAIDFAELDELGPNFDREAGKAVIAAVSVLRYLAGMAALPISALSALGPASLQKEGS